MEFFICLINAWKELFLLGENKSYAMVSTVIIEYRFIYGSSAEIERYTFTYSPEARSLQQKYHSLPETTMPGVSCQNFWE